MKKAKMDFIFLLTIISGLAAVTISAVTYYKGKQKEIAADSVTNELLNRTRQVAELQEELLKKSEELTKFLGASDAYPILSISSVKSNKGISGFTFKIHNEFEYPLYDVGINVLNFQFILDNSKYVNGEYIISKDNFTKSIIFLNEQTQVAPKSDVITPELHQINDGILYVKLKCRGRFVFEKIALVSTGNTVAHGFMVYDEKGTTLKVWYGQNPTIDIKKKLDEKFNLIPKSVTMKFTN